MSQSQHKRRSGVAAVEAAVCLPVIFLLVLGSIQASSYIFLKQSLHAAAYETARHATQLRATNSKARREGNALLNARQVKGGSIRFNVRDISKAPRGSAIRVTVGASTRRNTPLAAAVLANRRIQCQVVMVKE